MDEIQFESFLKNIESKINNMNLSNPDEYKYLFAEEKISIFANQDMFYINEIKEMLDNFNVKCSFYKPLKYQNPFTDEDEQHDINENSNDGLELSFGLNTNFQSLFIIVTFLKNFNLKKINYSNLSDNEVYLNPFDKRESFFSHYKLYNAIDLDKFNEFPFYYTTLDMLSSYFDVSKNYINSQVNRDPEEIRNEFFESNLNREDEYENDKNTFDALTDGQYGDFDDWKDSGGNFDDLVD